MHPTFLILASCILLGSTASAAVTFFDDTLPDAAYSATKTTDTTPGAAATFGAGQVLTGGNPDAFRLVDLSNVNPPGGIVVAHLWMPAAYDPAVDGPIGAIRAAFDGRFLGGSSGTSQFGYHLFFEQAGNRYVASNLVWFAVAHGPGNGLSGTWTNFSFPTLVGSQFVRNTGSGPLTPDFSGTGDPITFGYFTTTAAASIPVSITGGVDNVSFVVFGTNDVDLVVDKFATPESGVVGEPLVYTVIVTNAGPLTATGVLVADDLPAGAAFLTAQPSQGVCTQIAGVVTCDLGELEVAAAATVTITVTPSALGSLTNHVEVSADQADAVPDDNAAQLVTAVGAAGTDLTAELAAVFADCVATSQGLGCPVGAQLLLRNNGLVYGDALVSLTNVCKTTTVPAKCKLKGILTVNELDLTGLPDHAIAFYLSEDTVLDDGDFLMKSQGLSKALGAFVKGKPLKLSFKLPKGVDLTGLHILVEVDALDKKGFDAVVETDEANNTAASPPIPALP